MYPPRYNYPDSPPNNAIKIQQSLRVLEDFEDQFDTLKDSFSRALPRWVDFQGPDGIISVPVSSESSTSFDADNTPRLAYTPTNLSLHTYIESLDRLLIKLDGIQSWDDSSVREARRRIVGRINSEMLWVDACWKRAWATYIAPEIVELPSPEVASMKPQELQEQLMWAENQQHLVRAVC